MPAALLAAPRNLEKGLELCYKVVLETIIPSLIPLQIIYAKPKKHLWRREREGPCGHSSRNAQQ